MVQQPISKNHILPVAKISGPIQYPSQPELNVDHRLLAPSHTYLLITFNSRLLYRFHPNYDMADR